MNKYLLMTVMSLTTISAVKAGSNEQNPCGSFFSKWHLARTAVHMGAATTAATLIPVNPMLGLSTAMYIETKFGLPLEAAAAVSHAHCLASHIKKDK